MKINNFILCILIIVPLGFLMFYSDVHSEIEDTRFNQNEYALIDLNNWIYWVSSNGLSAINPYNELKAGIYPQGTAQVIFRDGLIWAGFISNNHISSNLRAGGSTSNNGMQCGWITESGSQYEPPKALPADDPRARIYRVRSDLFTLQPHEILEDAATYFDIDAREVSENLENELKQRYYKDWFEWPADYGAPFYDRNRNGKWDPDYDEPGIAGADQTIWYVVNDLNENKCMSLYGSLPIGLEVQVTIWAYKYKEKLLGNSIFKRYRLINKSAYTIESMFIGQYVESDIGESSDDFLGCDSVLNMGYAYNSSNIDRDFSPFNIIPPPAMGYILLQGPIIEAQGEQAHFDFKIKLNYKNLPMTAFWYKASGMTQGDPALGHFDGTLQVYNLMRGYAPTNNISNPTPFYHGSGNNHGNPTKFPVNGDPVTGTGDIDGEGNNFFPGDRRFFVSSGSFNMAPGDTQDIVLAIAGALGPPGGSNVSSVAQLQKYAPLLNEFWQGLNDFDPPKGPVPKSDSYYLPDYPLFILAQNYPNPFNNETIIRFRLLGAMNIRLSIYNLNGQLIKHILHGPHVKNEYVCSWDGRDNNGKLVPSGIYIIRMQSDAKFQIKKMILIK